MSLLTLLLAIKLFTLPTVPEALDAPADRAVYLAEHYWDNTPLNEEIIHEHPSEYEQFLVDFLSILPLIDEGKQAQLLSPLWAFSTRLIRHYLNDEGSPITDRKLYRHCLSHLADNSQHLILQFLYQDNCDTCQRTLQRLDNSSIIAEATNRSQLTIRAVKTSDAPRLWLTNAVGDTIMSEITIDELEIILQHFELQN